MVRHVSIIGLGLIGGSIAKGLKKSLPELIISAFDSKSVLNQGIDDGSIDKALDSVDGVLESEIIFICTPLDVSIQLLKELAPKLNPEQLITDVAGVKGILSDVWSELKSNGIYIGGHPMTGKEKGGYTNSDPLLFENSVYVVTSDFFDNLDNLKNESEINSELLRIIESLGARITFLNPKTHDNIVANVSHLPQLLSVSLINSVAVSDAKVNTMNFSGGGFRDMTRIASSDFEIWESVLKFNKEKIHTAIENLKSELQKIQYNLQNEDYTKLAELFESARKYRDEIPKDTKGFLTTLHDIFVFVEDKPGVIYKISSTLFENSINIKDMELLKIREGTGGTFRLSLETESDVIKAKRLLKQVGFEIARG
ncbi:MAG: prephenate dehydrogenase/arogenate dehydrogenase family protein [Melioribacteraceae bacterium]|nr:prephenate dehydrogenase/arogenate dehydrogenase family protein [Melioribacteraceae bacterium]MCF8355525.1 prephenate dehydrogenase/arogenate dehydrogenase family protein [Melioribacteraceae bacterium]MCF8394520.1 prephenate dehydrogenase/arogenate dehydrogenase family protein [Melioribacteraceae bacterium]MCF8420136.1 prephenate dehydrogenase/arogenate dehydrogenase family protein [Melioribacteraceae bacterium]